MTIDYSADQMGAVARSPGRVRRRGISPQLVSWLQVGPLALILGFFLILPLIGMLVVSFFDYGRMEVYPTFILDSYQDIFSSTVTLRLYAKTFEFCAMTLVLTFILGFFVSYFVTFHVRSGRMRLILLFTCSVPFFTSVTIRMITWLPFLGRNGLLNSGLMSIGLIHQPLEFLLFSDFAVMVAYVNIYTLMMMGPTLNSMMKIDRSLIAAARDAGASEWQIVTNIIAPLSKTGIAIGSVLVVTQVMGDYGIMRTLSGGQSSGVLAEINNQLGDFEWPPAAAESIILLIIVMVMAGAIFRSVDIRKELSA